MILVTGATGTVGRALINQLVAAAVPVRALTRRRSTARLPPGVEVREADLADPASLQAVVKDVEQVFLLSTGPTLAVHDANVARAAAEAGVGRLVKLSSGRVDEPAAIDPIPNWHRAGEKAVRDSGLAWTMLRPMGFMSNALYWAGSIRAQDTVYAPYGHGRVAAIDPQDIAAVARIVLTTPGHEGQAYLLSGPQALSPGEQTDILAGVLGRPLRYVEVSPQTARLALLEHGESEVTADAIMALRATAMEEFMSTVRPTVEKITGRPAGTFRDWVERHRDRFW